MCYKLSTLSLRSRNWFPACLYQLISIWKSFWSLKAKKVMFLKLIYINFGPNNRDPWVWRAKLGFIQWVGECLANSWLVIGFLQELQRGGIEGTSFANQWVYELSPVISWPHLILPNLAYLYIYIYIIHIPIPHPNPGQIYFPNQNHRVLFYVLQVLTNKGGIPICLPSQLPSLISWFNFSKK